MIHLTPPTTTSYKVYDGNHPYILERENKEKQEVLGWYKKGYGIQWIAQKTEYLSIAEVKKTLYDAGIVRRKPVHNTDKVEYRLLLHIIYYEYCQGLPQNHLIKKYHTSPKIVREAIKDYPYTYQVNKDAYFKEGGKKYSSLSLWDMNKAYTLFSEGYELKGVCAEIPGANWSNMNLYYHRLLLGRLRDAYDAYNQYHGSIPYPLNEEGGESI